MIYRQRRTIAIDELVSLGEELAAKDAAGPGGCPLMALILVAIPFVAAVLGLCLGRSRTAAAVVAIGGAAAALVVAVAHLRARSHGKTFGRHSGLSGDFQPLPFSTTVDGLSVTVAMMVCFVALMVQIYSVGYMRGEPRYASYSAFISLFTSAMLAVVVAGDLLFLVVGWEVMGLCSYLLIGQHWERRDAQRAAVKAFLVTKVGDVGFIVGIVVLIGATGTLLLPEAVAAASANPPWPPSSRCCCSSESWVSRRSSRCMPGCPTRWRARRRSARSSTRRRWWLPAST